MSQPRYRDLIADLQYVARREIIFGDPRARGPRRPRQGRPRGQRHASARATPARPIGQLALLARPADRPSVHPHADLPRLSARRHPAALRGFRGLVGAHRVHGRQQGHPRLHLPVVRRSPAPELRHGRDPGHGLSDARGAHARARRARSRRWSRSSPSTTRRARSCRATRTRCSTRTSGWPRATGSTASSWTCPTRERVPAPELARRVMDRLRPHAEELGSTEDLDRRRGHPRERQRRVAPGGGLRGQPRPQGGREGDREATVPEPAEHPAGEPGADP